MKIQLFQFALLFFVLAASATAQTINNEQIDEPIFTNWELPPKTRLLDLGDIFRGREAEREELARKFDSLATDHGFSVYFVAYSGIIGSNVFEKAKQFRDDWLGTEEEGLIFVCDTDMKNMAYALTKVDGLSVNEKNHHSWKLPDHEAIAALQTLTEVTSTENSEKEYLNLIGHALANKLDERLQAQKEQQKSGSWGLVATFAVTAALVFLGIWWVQSRSSPQTISNGPHFPEIKIGKRLGAQFGGGVVYEITYQPPSPSESP